MNATVLAERLEALLQQVWSIRLEWQNPELFHEAKSEAIGNLKSLIAEAGHLQDGVPVVATKARAALRLLETQEAPPSPPAVSALPTPVVTASASEPAVSASESSVEIVDQSDASHVKPGFSPSAGVPPLPPAAEPTSETAQAINLTVLEQSIAAAVSGITRILGDIERLALAASTAYATALALPSQIVPPHVPQAALPAMPARQTPQASADSNTFYHRGHLMTAEGRTIAASLWADGLSRGDIAKCFDYADSNGSACVAAAIATFLRLHCPAETGTMSGEAGKDLVRRAGDRLRARPAAEGVDRTGNS